MGLLEWFQNLPETLQNNISESVANIGAQSRARQQARQALIDQGQGLLSAQWNTRHMDPFGAVAEGFGGITSPVGKPVQEAVKAISEKFPSVNLSVSNSPNGYVINKIVVPESERGNGIGTKIMESIIDAAKTEGAQLSLTPSADFGGKINKLTDWYKSLGFEKNSGRSRDFSIRETMKLDPKSIGGLLGLGAAADQAQQYGLFGQ